MAIATMEPVKLEGDQVRDAGAVLARAFQTNPLMVYLVPDEAKRRRVLPWSMSTGSRYGYRYGEVHTTPDEVMGAAVWLPPGQTSMTPLRMARAGLLAAPLKVGVSAFFRFMSTMNRFEHLHKQDVPPEHWYLMILGVDPPHQRKGIGSALLQPILRRADAGRLPCYLETDKEEDVIFYRRHGFEVVREIDLPKSGPRVWTMKREAARS